MQHFICLRLAAFALAAALIGAVAAPVSLSTAQAPVAPAPGTGTTLYVPLIIKRAGQLETGVQVQNLSAAAADLTVTYYDPDGLWRPEWVQRASVAPNDAWTFYTPDVPNLPPGFVGSAVIQSTQPVGAIVNQQSLPDVRPFSLGTFDAPRAPGNTVHLPYALKQVNGRTSIITVQNTAAAPATVNASFYSREGLVGRVELRLPAFTARWIPLAERGDLPASMDASVVLQADQPIVAIGDVFDSATGIRQVYTGIPTGAPSQLAPLVFNDRNGWDSDIRIQNTTASPVNVRVRLQPTGGGTEIASPSVSIAPYAPYTFRPRDVGIIPSNFVGSAQIEASGNVVAVVTEYNAGTGNGMAYNAFGPTAGTTRISVPLVFKERNGFNTGVQVQNVDNTDAQVRITYRLATGATLVDFGVVPANASFTFYQGDPNNDLPPGSVGSAIVENIAGAQRLVVIVNEVNYTRGGDASSTYEGLNL